MKRDLSRQQNSRETETLDDNFRLMCNSGQDIREVSSTRGTSGKVGGDDGGEVEQIHGEAERRRRTSALNWCFSSFIGSMYVAKIHLMSVTVESNVCWISTSLRFMASGSATRAHNTWFSFCCSCTLFAVSLTIQCVCIWISMRGGMAFGMFGENVPFGIAPSVY
jgi:hypothetical protein